MILRYRKLGLDEVLPLVKYSAKEVEFDVEPFLGKMYSLDKTVKVNCSTETLLTFKTKGVECTKCNLKGTHFWIQRALTDYSSEKPHLALYGWNNDGKEVRFTRDHIVAKADGGKDGLY